MAFLAGERITATRLNRLQPVKYAAVGSGTLTGPQTNADVTDATITLTTETDGAGYVAWCVWDINTTGAAAGTATMRLNFDTANLTPLATFNGPDSGERSTVTQVYEGTVTTAGSHTFKLVASPNTNQQIQGVNSSIIVEITEVV